MTENAVAAPAVSSRVTGPRSGLVESIGALVGRIRGRGWVDGLLAGGTAGGGAGANQADPFAPLAANGLGWAMEYFEPLRQLLDDLTGKPEVARAHAAAWNDMATELRSAAADLRSCLGNDLPGWQGEAADAYQRLMANNVEALEGLAEVSTALASATEDAGNLVEVTRQNVHGLIVDLVHRVVTWAGQAQLEADTSEVAAQIATTVAEWAGHIEPQVTALINSLTNLTDILDG